MMGNREQKSKVYFQEVSVNTDKPALPENFTLLTFIPAL
jgi:hypothetical protein